MRRLLNKMRTVFMAAALGVLPAAAWAQLTMSPNPADLDFGNVAVGGTAQLEVTFTNSGSAPLPLLSVTGGAAGSFGGVSNCGGTLAPGDSCPFRYTFAPTSVGLVTGSTTIELNNHRLKPVG